MNAPCEYAPHVKEMLGEDITTKVKLSKALDIYITAAGLLPGPPYDTIHINETLAAVSGLTNGSTFALWGAQGQNTWWDFVTLAHKACKQ